MAWTELKRDGGRRVIDRAPRFIDYIISFKDARATATIPSAGSTYATVTGTATTLGSTGVDGEPEAVEISEITYATGNQAHITVRFRAHYTISSGGTWYELYPRRSMQVGDFAYKCRRRFVCDDGDAISLRRELWNKAFPGLGGGVSPKAKPVEILSGFKPGKSLVTAYYDNSNKGHTQDRVPGKARVRLAEWSDSEKLLYDVSGDIVEGRTDVFGEFYQVVRGSNIVPVSRAKMIIETAFSSFPLDDLMDKAWHVNEHAMGAFGSSVGRPGAILMLGIPSTKFWWESGLFYFDIALAYCGPEKKQNISGSEIDVNLWNNQLWTRKFTNAVYQVPTYDGNGVLLPNTVGKEWQTITGPVPFDRNGNQTDIEVRARFDKADLNEINGWITWEN